MREDMKYTSHMAGIMTCVLDGMDIAVFVTDMLTDEILYVNEALRRMLSSDSLIGSVCWEVLMNRSRRCEWCPISYLLKNPGKRYCWMMEACGRQFLVQDSIVPWVRGKLTHMQYIVDVTEGLEQA